MDNLIFLVILFFVIFFLLGKYKGRNSGDGSAEGRGTGYGQDPYRQNDGYSRGSYGGNTYTGNGSQGYRNGNVYYNERKEVQEAIRAGEYALSSLQSAERKLVSARGWGMVDIAGGGLISGVLKHERMSEASRYIEEAKRALMQFRNELDDIRSLENVNIDVGSFLTFADFFFDGLIMDFVVQSKINETRRQLTDAIGQVERMLDRLYAMNR